MAKSIKRQVKDAVMLVMPSGIRDAYERYALSRANGLVHFGPWSKYFVINSRFGKRCRLSGSCIIRDCTFGDYSYAETGVRITQATIGKFCSIGPGATIGLAGHPVEKYSSTHPVFYLNQPVLGYDLIKQDTRSDYMGTTIGNDIWVGANALIKDGVTIGDGAIIGAGAVVTKDVEPYTIVAGVPAKTIRKRFDDQAIQALLEIRWWDRDEAWLRDHAEEMSDVEKLLAWWARARKKSNATGSANCSKEQDGVS